jgi:hypothetical protein
LPVSRRAFAHAVLAVSVPLSIATNDSYTPPDTYPCDDAVVSYEVGPHETHYVDVLASTYLDVELHVTLSRDEGLDVSQVAEIRRWNQATSGSWVKDVRLDAGETESDPYVMYTTIWETVDGTVKVINQSDLPMTVTLEAYAECYTENEIADVWFEF